MSKLSKIVPIFILLVFVVGNAFAQEPTPTPVFDLDFSNPNREDLEASAGQIQEDANDLFEIGENARDGLEEIESVIEDVEIGNDGSVTVFGQRLNPELDNQLFTVMLGYTKWLMTAGADSVFGPFAGLVPHIFVFVLLAFVEPVAMGAKTALATGAAIISWIAENFIAFLVIAIILAVVAAIYFLAENSQAVTEWSINRVFLPFINNIWIPYMNWLNGTG